MKQVYNSMIIRLALISLLTLPACNALKTKMEGLKSKIDNAKYATNKTTDRLHQEANQYQYSSYVQKNLKARKISHATVSKYSTLSLQHYNLQQTQLTQRKQKSRARIQSAMLQNGLYTPAPTLWRQLNTLHDSQSHQAWLERHNSLKGILALALKNNLDIKSQQQSAFSLLSQYDQVSYLDDMLLQYNAFTNDISLTGSTQKNNHSASKNFPFPALRALKANILDQNIETARLNIKQTAQDIITQSKLAYYELQYSQYDINIKQQMGKLLTSLKQELKNNYEVNTSKLSNIVQIDIELAANKNDIKIAKNVQHTQQIRLNALLNLPSYFKLYQFAPLTSQTLPDNPRPFVKIAKTKRIEIIKLTAEIEKIQRVIQLSERRFYPDFDAGYSRFQNTMSKQLGSNALQSTFNNRPKIKSNSFFASNDAYLNETKQKIKTLQAKIKALKTQTEAQLQQAHTRYQSQQHNHNLYQNKLIPKAKLTLDIAKNNFETGDSNFIDLIQAKESILRYRLLAFKAVKDMNKEVAQIKRIMGKE